LQPELRRISEEALNRAEVSVASTAVEEGRFLSIRRAADEALETHAFVT
jgi:hypothetical protein